MDETKIPFYLAKQRKIDEFKYLKENYSFQLKEIADYINNHVDGLCYEESRIFDENMDRLMFQKEVEFIYNQLKERYATVWLRAIIELLLGNEIYYRRLQNP